MRNSSAINHQLPDRPPSPGVVRVRVEVAPGFIKEVEVPAEMLERHVCVKLVPLPDKPGVMREYVRVYHDLVPLTDDLGERMGWGLERRQILALLLGGFIYGCRGTCSSTQISPASVWEHLHNCRMVMEHGVAVPASKVWTAENVRRYADAADFVRNCGIVSTERRKAAEDLDHLEFNFDAPAQTTDDKAA